MIARIRRFGLAALLLTISGGAAPSAGAQEPSVPGGSVAAPAPSELGPPGPTVDRAAVGARTQQVATPAETEPAIQQRLGLGRARALMIVGFATVIVGLLIGDDPGTLIAIAGAAVGLYGLYHYLK
jgi:hypothetical protein